jgi:hypothetical protein
VSVPTLVRLGVLATALWLIGRDATLAKMKKATVRQDP